MCPESSACDLDALLERTVGQDPTVELARLAGGVGALSVLFTKGQAEPAPPYLSDETLRRSYLAYFFPVNLAKVQAVLDELPEDWPETASDQSVFRVLDLGSGPGSASLGALEWLVRERGTLNRPIELDLVDRTAVALRVARSLLDRYGRTVPDRRVTVRTSVANLERGGWLRRLSGQEAERYDLIVVANCLNELFRERRDACDRRARVLEACLERLAPHGALVVVEPASRPAARGLHRVRDLVLARTASTVYSPCLHDHPCQALVKEGDWCHEERPWTAPAIVRAIDRRVGFIKDALKFSYVVLRLDGRTIVPREADVYRVVSELRELKGETRAWLCGAPGRMETGRLDRARSERNGALDAWHRGAIVRVEEIVRKPAAGREAGSLGRVPAEGGVQILRGIAR